MSAHVSRGSDETLPFGDWLKRRRRILDLTREQLAWQVGCSFETIKKIESSDLKPSAQLAGLLASKLAVPAPEHAAFIHFARSGECMPPTAFTDQPAPLNRPPAPAVRPIFHLPAPLTALIGRDHEQRAILQILHLPGVRLLTLTGPPGVGKTRLALEIAAQLQDVFVDGVCFVPLAPISDPALVPTAILHALELQNVSDQPVVATLTAALRHKHLLLVLDNVEQVLAAAPFVGALLGAAAQVRVLATSREALRIYGEHAYPVGPLAVPDIGQSAPVELRSSTAAVALFVARAQAASPTFTLTTDNRASVFQLCALLDGLPLAIEMAAAQLRRLAPQELLVQVQTRMGDLRSDVRDQSPRHQSLRGALDGSFHGLTPHEQRVFTHAGIFIGGCTPLALAAVLDTTLPESVAHVRDVLEALIDKSLMRRDTTAEDAPRYGMLETIRTYALDQLTTIDGRNEARQRHATYFARWALALEPQLHTANQIAWFGRVETEHNNLRAVADWAVHGGDVVAGLQVASGLWDVWVARGYQQEWVERLRHVLGRVEASTQTAALQLAYAQGLNACGFMEWLQGSRAVARPLLKAALALAQTLDDRPTLARSLLYLSLVDDSEDAREAHELLEASLVHWRVLDDAYHWGWALVLLGDSALRSGDPHQAQRHYSESIDRLRAIGNKNMLAYGLRRVSQLALAEREYAHALVLCEESVLLNLAVGDQRGVAGCLVSLAAVALARTQPDNAARLLGAADAARKRSTTLLLPADDATYTHTLALTQVLLGETACAEAWNDGHNLLPVQAAALALSANDAGSGGSHHDHELPNAIA